MHGQQNIKKTVMRFEILTLVLVKMQAVWDVTLCTLVNTRWFKYDRDDLCLNNCVNSPGHI